MRWTSALKISKQYAEHYRWGDQCDDWHLVKNKDLSIIHECMATKTVEVNHLNQRCCTQDMATPSVESSVTLLLSI
ncbi:hypothetical protein [Lysinibacillus sp. NPDC093688]|uniref:hypothetical protein n=1 Tax=Lysinibacillus sp. NPDC093688 TaxID=3390577 RepID=UPI003CFC0A18